MIELLFLQAVATEVQVIKVTCSNVIGEARLNFEPTDGFQAYQGVVADEQSVCDGNIDVIAEIRDRYAPDPTRYSTYVASAYRSFASPEFHFYIRDNSSAEASIVSVYRKNSEATDSEFRISEQPIYLVFRRPASYSEQSHIEFLVQGMSICNSSESTEPGLDGTNWVFEEWALNGHCTHSMWSPRFGELARFGNYVSSLGQRMLSDHIGLESEEE